MNCSFILEEEGLTIYECSKISGIPYSTLSDIIKGKTPMERISFKTARALAKALDISMEELYDRTNVPKRMSFENFKSSVCHELKELGDLGFIARTLEENMIMDYYHREWYPECLYLLAMLDYVSKENGIALCSDYDDIRKITLSEIIYPASILALTMVSGNKRALKIARDNAIPEFMKFNIVESEIRNVI